MAEFEVKTESLKKSSESGRTIYLRMDSLSSKIGSVANGIALGSTAGRIVKDELRELAEKTSENAMKTQTIFDSLKNIALCYGRTEEKIGNHSGKKETEDIWTRIWKHYETISGSVASGVLTKTGSVLGFQTSGTLEGNVIGGSVSRKSKAKWDLQKKDAEFGENIEAEGHLAEGKASGNIGIASGSVKGSVVAAGATGTIGVSLYKDGKLSPSVKAKIKVEGAVAKGDAEAKVGNNENNIHAKASGSVLAGEAAAEGYAGKITYKDETTGTTKTEWGLKGKVGAEAYVAQGKISGGFSICGIKVDIGVSGKAGGAGIAAEGRATTGGVKGKIDLGLGVGGGIEIGVDWSNFSLKNIVPKKRF